MEKPRHRLTSEVTYTNLVEVFVDDFISVTNHPSLSQLTHLLRAILYGVHYILPTPNITKKQGKYPISQKN